MTRPEAVEGSGKLQTKTLLQPQEIDGRGPSRLNLTSRSQEWIKNSWLNILLLPSILATGAVGMYGVLKAAEGFQANVASARSEYSFKDGIPSQRALTPKTVIASDYIVNSMSTSGSRVAALVTLPDSIQHLVVGDLYDSGDLLLRDKGVMPFLGLGITVSETDPNLIAVVGDRALRASQGRLMITNNSVATSRVYEYESGAMFDVKFSPNIAYAYIGTSDPSDEYLPVYTNFNLATERFTKLSVPVGFGVSEQTPLRSLSEPGTSGNYSIRHVYPGYWRNTFYPDGTMASESLNYYQGYLSGVKAFVDSQGRHITGAMNTDSHCPGTPQLWCAVLYYNVNDILTDQVYGKRSFYPTANLLGITMSDAMPNRKRDLLFLATSTARYDFIYDSYIEVAPTEAPNDLNRRWLLTRDGVYPKVGTRGATRGTLGLLTRGDEEVLIESIRSQEIWANSGLFYLKSPIISSNIWEKSPVVEDFVLPTPTPDSHPYKVNLPKVGKNQIGK